MNDLFKLAPHTVSVWQVKLSDFTAETTRLQTLLSQDELQRALRYRFAKHQERFIIARAMLRHILSLYIGEPPERIQFEYGPQGKPALTKSKVQFNVSHSDDMAVYAVSFAEVGIDIEKIEEKDHDALAKRFFSETEQTALAALTKTERMAAFYQMWAGKEAVVKAIGNGLYAALRDFTVQLTARQVLKSKQEDIYLEQLSIDPEYAAAVATCQPITAVFYWQWTLKGPISLTPSTEEKER